jgi:hypothetical protein
MFQSWNLPVPMSISVNKDITVGRHGTGEGDEMVTLYERMGFSPICIHHVIQRAIRRRFATTA